jgi:GGDEF domain-containing protein
MNATRDTSMESAAISPAHEASTHEAPPHEAMIEPTPMAQFLPAFLMYVGWSTLAWLSQITGALIIAPPAAKIILLGVGATNILFYLIARNNTPHRPPTDTITLAQCVVGIAWVTLFTFMSSGSGELAIGIYASIVLFAILKVRHSVLNQIIIFAISSYLIISLVKMLSTVPLTAAPTSLLRLLIFSGIMLCLSEASRHIHRRHKRLETRLAGLQAKFQHEHAGTSAYSVNRRYILDLLAREKGRTDRSNVPFCICIFTVHHGESATTGMDKETGEYRLTSIEALIRTELRDMDSLNATGFNNCFGAYSDREFVTVLPQTNLSGARHSAERIVAAITTQTETDEAPISLSAGIAEYRRGEDIAELLGRAEAALGKARASDDERIYAGEISPKQSATRYADIVRLETRHR